METKNNQEQEIDMNQLMQVRKEKLDKLIQEGKKEIPLAEFSKIRTLFPTQIKLYKKNKKKAKDFPLFSLLYVVNYFPIALYKKECLFSILL